MNELIDFSEKLSTCDFIAITPVSQDRMYCRFYADGLYVDRMFISHLSLLEDLILLSKDDEVIEENGISRLKNKYAEIPKTNDEESCSEPSNFE
ncbi:hypothetical protein GCM10023188_16960 [Pontibacter saemangeumensis]|uniref:Uncharacterized protein n=1 Tax=Pontibacter saemangeumensis TaxID=1084525 RepID=A0ABP8LJ92_9BACT